MLEYYGEIRWLHIAAVAVSGSLFVLRGLGILLSATWPRHTAVRYSTYAVDTLLLTAALMLMSITHQYPHQQSWLFVKIVCLALYIFLGIKAFRNKQTLALRFIYWLAAMIVYGFIISVAVTRHPAGLIYPLYISLG